MEQAAPRPKLSVIVVTWNDEVQFPYVYDRARPILDQLPDVDWSLVFVNNASTDETLPRILQLRQGDDRVKVLTLSRNFGYHAALVAGLSSIESDLYAILDVDCEDPPELLIDFYSHVSRGVQLVYGVRSEREEFPLMTFGRWLFYALNWLIADSDMTIWMGEFSMMTRQVRDAVITPRTTFPFIRAEMGYVGFQPVGLPYHRSKKKFGKSHYGPWLLIQFAVAGVLAATTFPLRAVLYVSVALAISFPVVLLAAGLRLDQAGSLAAIITLYFVLMSVSMLALYLARTYRNVTARPVFVIDRQRTFL